MAYYENLPIYKKALELTIYIETIVKGFSRYHKYSLGTRIRERSANILGKIIEANNLGKEKRISVLESLRIEVESLKTDLVVAKEIRAFGNFNSFRHAASLAVDIGRQNEGWIRSLKEVSVPDSRTQTTG
jgi:hypothetical protein